MITKLGCIALLIQLAGQPTPTSSHQKKTDPTSKTVVTKAPKAKTKAKAVAKKAKTKKANPLANKVQRYYERIEDYSADFIQRYTRIALSRTTESRGKLYLKKPGMMRWQYEKPAEKLWVVDGKKLVVYDPEFEQVIIDPDFKTEELSTSIRFLWGEGNLHDSFRVESGSPADFGLTKTATILVLMPKRDATYTRLVLVVNPKTGQVEESIIMETSGNTNHFKFRNPAINKKLKKTLFDFVPPEGVEISYR